MSALARTHRRLTALVGALPIALILGAAQGCADRPTATEPALPPALTRSSAGDPGLARPSEATRRRLERAAAGLLYTSESDYPFDYVFLPADASPPLTAAAFRAVADIPADSLVEEQTLDAFFARHIERVDPADARAVALVPRYQALKRTIRASVRGARVFRVGRIAIRCYVVGVDARGNVVGLATTSIET